MDQIRAWLTIIAKPARIKLFDRGSYTCNNHYEKYCNGKHNYMCTAFFILELKLLHKL